MTKHMIRILAAIATASAMVACSETQTATTTDPTTVAFSKGGSNTNEASTIIVLTRASTSPFARATGKAKFLAKPNERELEIEVEDVPAGTVLAISLGGKQIGTATANSFGNAELELSSERGATVPASVTGLKVVVKTTGGVVVVSGSF